MGLFHRMSADNIGAIKKWHDRQHIGEWRDCVYEPCNQTDTTWRGDWS
jgi:hypothetical protein